MKGKLLAVALALVSAGCVHSPVRSSQMEQDLVWLDTHGHDDGEVDKPKIPALAVILDILPIPGVGHYYVGDIGDGLKTSLLFWLIVPWIKGPIDAYKEASFKNDQAYIEHAKEHGWFDERDNPGAAKKAAPRATKPDPAEEDPAASEPPPSRAKPGPAASPRQDDMPSSRGDPQPSTTKPAASNGKSDSCVDCGQKFEANFCAGCGRHR